MTSKTTEVIIVEVECKLCGQPIKFDINDSETFLSKTEHDSFFGTELHTFRVEHRVNGEAHVNSVLIDHKGLFRGYVDAYRAHLKEETQKLDLSNIDNFVNIGEEMGTITTNPLFSNLLIINSVGWILEIVKLANLNTVSLIKNILAKVEESKKIYTEIPNPLKITVADLELHIWSENETILIASLRDENKLSVFSEQAEAIVQSIEASDSMPNKRTYRLLLRILSNKKAPQMSGSLVTRLLTDDLFYSKIKTKYPERLPMIVPKIAKRYNLPEEILEQLLKGEVSVIELLENDLESSIKYKTIIETLDSINRRNLLAD